MLKKIYGFINHHIRYNIIFEGITFLICGILGFILVFVYALDSTPATLTDYEPLIKQNSTIQENFNTVYTYDNYSISPIDENIQVTFSNEQCKLACTYDNNFNFINYEKIDLAASKASAILASLFLGFCMFGTVGMYFIAIFIPFILYYLLKFLEWLCLLLVERR